MGTKTIKLPYGGILLHNRNNVNKAINVQINFKVGSANTAYKPGLLHFGEHLRANRTKDLTKQQIIEENSKKSITFGASTSKNKVEFYLFSHKKYFKNSFSSLIDVMLFDKMTNIEFETEKKIIIAEINRTKTDINRQFYIKSNKIIYTNKYYHINNIGEEKNVVKYTNKQVQNHISKIINSNNLVVSISGNITSFFAKRYVKKILVSQISHEKPEVIALDMDPVFAEKSKFFLSKTEYEANTVLIVIPTKISNCKDLKQLIIIGYIEDLIGGGNGEIYKSLRLKSGLIYTSSTFDSDDSQSFYIKFQTKKENINKTIEIVAEVLKNISMSPLKKKELDEIDKINKELSHTLTNSRIAERASEQFLKYEKIIKRRLVENIKRKITVSDINSAIKNMMTDNKVFVIVEGDADKKDVMPIKKIEKLFFCNTAQKN